jgi:type II secretory pathway component PulJ
MLDSIVSYLFAEQTKRLDQMETKINKLEKDVEAILNAICTSQSPKERIILGREQGNREETQHKPVTQTQSGSPNESSLCG